MMTLKSYYFGLKIGENGGMVIGTMKVTDFCQVLASFHAFRHPNSEVYNIKHVDIHVLIIKDLKNA